MESTPYIDPILCYGFSCRIGSTADPILSVTNLRLADKPKKLTSSKKGIPCWERESTRPSPLIPVI